MTPGMTVFRQGGDLWTGNCHFRAFINVKRNLILRIHTSKANYWFCLLIHKIAYHLPINKLQPKESIHIANNPFSLGFLRSRNGMGLQRLIVWENLVLSYHPYGVNLVFITRWNLLVPGNTIEHPIKSYDDVTFIHGFPILSPFEMTFYEVWTLSLIHI